MKEQEGTTGFNLPLGGTNQINRNDRYTFASYTKETPGLSHHRQHSNSKLQFGEGKSGHRPKDSSGHAWQSGSNHSNKQRNQAEDPNAAYNGPNAVNSSNPKQSEGESSATFLAQQTFNASKEQHESQRHGNPNNASIGKDVDKKELSIIQHKYDSRYQELMGNSLLDPLITANANLNHSKGSSAELERVAQD